MKTRTRIMIIFLCLTVLLVLSPYHSAQAASCTWDGSNGNWDDDERWSCPSGPGMNDDAIINGGQVTLSTNTSVLSLTFSGGLLKGTGNLTADTINWSGGMMEGPGSATASSEANFTGSDLIQLIDGYTFNNAGAATWNRTGELYINPLTTNFNNQLGASFTVQTAGGTMVSGGGMFTNDGTISYASPGGSTISLGFVNSSTGTVSVESGLFEISNMIASVSPSSGTYHVLPGAALRLRGATAPFNLSGSITGTGTGTIEIAGVVNITGTFTFPGTISITGINYGRLNLSTNSTTVNIGILNMSDTNGTLMGPGHLTAGTINWSRGTMSGTGSTTASSALNFTGSDLIQLIDGRTFNNAGAATWNRTGELYINPLTTNFNNQLGATFTVQSSGSYIVSGGGTFRNAGTLNLTTGTINTNTFTQEAGGITNLAIRGTTPVTDYSQLIVSNLILTGPLNISFSGGYTPNVGDHFILQQYSSTRTGNFSPVNINPIPGIIWVLYYKDGSLHLWAMKCQIFIPLLIK